MARSKGPGVDDLVEQMGVFYKTLGAPRAAGQMLGYLMACDPPEQSAREISGSTGLSPASVSSSARLLGQMGALEERHRVGDRKTYYRLRTNFWIETAKSKLQVFDQLAELGRSIKAAGGLTRTDGIDEMIAFSEFWQDLLPEYTERWERRLEAMSEEA